MCEIRKFPVFAHKKQVKSARKCVRKTEFPIFAHAGQPQHGRSMVYRGMLHCGGRARQRSGILSPSGRYNHSPEWSRVSGGTLGLVLIIPGTPPAGGVTDSHERSVYVKH